jgi:peptide-methionine (S)-S-oxide reductase
VKKLALAITFLMLATACGGVDAAAGAGIPGPVVDEHTGSAADRFAVFSGGCFWGVDAVFKHVKGVKTVVSGYAGGSAATAHYPIVSDGQTGHAESVEVVYDPTQVSYGQLLQIFFSVAHDPTELNRQGPDTGTQYRSAIFFASSEQQQIARAYVDQLTKAKVFKGPIVTQINKLDTFYPAESYHQNYFASHPNDLYIVINDAPKVAHLKDQFPNIYKDR